jgi:Pyruvate formate lyase-like
MHHNDVQFWRHLQLLKEGHEDLPSPRVCRLLLRAFEGWKSRPGWVTESQIGHLFRGRSDLSKADKAALAREPVIIRKALAIKRMLELIASPEVARTSGSMSIAADELIVGTLPPFSVGQGKEFVRYLTEEEELAGALDFLNELSPMGHIVPDHGVVIQRGLAALAEEARARSAPPARSKDAKEKADFYEAVAISLEAVIEYAARYAALARSIADRLPDTDPNKQSLNQVAANLAVAPAGPAKTFRPCRRSTSFTARCTGRSRSFRSAASTSCSGRSTNTTSH